MRLTTVGRRSGKERGAILGYYEDGPNLVTTAMNGWSEGEPAWWLTLLAHPDATVELADGPRRSAVARQRARNASACGPGGTRWATTSMGTPRAARPGRRSSSWSRGRRLGSEALLDRELLLHAEREVRGTVAARRGRRRWGGQDEPRLAAGDEACPRISGHVGGTIGSTLWRTLNDEEA